MPVTKSSWEEAEEQVFDYLSKNIPDTDLGRNGFIGELPPNTYEAWSFAITGPGGAGWEPECRTWQMAGEIVGRFVERQAAQELAQWVRTNLVATSADIDTIQRVRMEDGPTLSRISLQVDNQARAFWQITIPLMVTFDNTDPT